MDRLFPFKKLKGLSKSDISRPSNFRHVAHMEKEHTEDDTYLRPSGSSAKNSPTMSNEQIRNYENKKTSHQYCNVSSEPRPSTKQYRAPSPPRDPPTELAPNLDEDGGSQTVTFRSLPSRTPIKREPINIGTPMRIEQENPNSLVIDRPGILLGKENNGNRLLNENESPLLNTPNSPCSWTLKSTTRQGELILNDLDDWLNCLEEEDQKKVLQIETDGSGELTLDGDRKLMENIIEKYNMNMKPETVRIRRDVNRKTFDYPNTNNVESVYATVHSGQRPALSETWSLGLQRPRPVSPPAYDAPSYPPPSNLRRVDNKLEDLSQIGKMARTSQGGTMSSTDYSTTSTRYSKNDSFDIVSDEEPEKIESPCVKPPMPLPRRKLMVVADKSEESNEANNFIVNGLYRNMGKPINEAVKHSSDDDVQKVEKQEDEFVVNPLYKKEIVQKPREPETATITDSEKQEFVINDMYKHQKPSKLEEETKNLDNNNEINVKDVFMEEDKPKEDDDVELEAPEEDIVIRF